MRREIEAQKEVYRLQIQNMAEIEVQASPVRAKPKAAQQEALSLIGRHRVPVVKTDGSPTIKTA